MPPHIDMGRELRLETGDTVLLSTDGFWAQIPANILAQHADQADGDGAHAGAARPRRSAAPQGESDNVSVVAMTWENQDDARVADTQTLDDEEFATSTNTTEQLGDGVPSTT